MKTGKMKLKALALMLLIAILLPPLSLADGSGQWAVVKGTSTLNIRSGPNTEAAWLGKAYEGDWVEILTTETNGWHYCHVLSNGIYGYMSGNYLSTGGKTPSSSQNIGVVNNPVPTQFLNLRAFPSYSAQVLGIFYNGVTCQILSYNDGWYYVYVNGIYGYFRSEFIRLQGGQQTGKAVIATGNSGKLNMRSQPLASAALLGQFSNGTRVDVLLKGNSFWLVEINGLQGFMASSFLREEGAEPLPPVKPDPAPVTKGYAVVSNPSAASYLNLRETPSTAAKVLAQYYNGVRLEMIEQGEIWCHVYGKSSGKNGYVMTKFVTLYGLPSVPTRTVSNGSSYVNLRTQPSKKTGTVIQRVWSGQTVTILIPGGEWTKIRYNGSEGYMMSAFLK